MIEEEHVAEHCKQIHGLDEGITSLSPLQVIEVDKNQAFTCPSLHKIEDFGPEQHKLLATSVYYNCIAKGIFTTTNNNRSTADLKPNRSQEFLEEVKKACSKTFYGRLNMHLGNKHSKMEHNIRGDFTCKWSTVEDSLFKAIGDEQEVT